MPQNVSMSLKHRLNYLVDRQGVVSGNIANASTPGYSAKDISFEKLVTANSMNMATTNGGHIKGQAISGGKHRMTEDRTHMRHDGNSVKMDEEMLKLQDIQMNYRLATELYKKQVSFQKLALGRSGQ